MGTAEGFGLGVASDVLSTSLDSSVLRTTGAVVERGESVCWQQGQSKQLAQQFFLCRASVVGIFSKQLEQKCDSISWQTQKPHLSFGQWRQKNSLLIGLRMPHEHAYLTGLGCMKLISNFKNWNHFADAEFLRVLLLILQMTTAWLTAVRSSFSISRNPGYI